MEKPSNISNLLERYISNTASPAEVRQLIAYFRAGGEVEAEVLRLMRLRLEETAGETDDSAPEIQLALSESLDKIKRRIHQTTATGGHMRRLPKVAAVVAASVLLFLMAGLGWIYYSEKQEPVDTELVSAYGGDVRAGSDLATLTLSDGRVVTLNRDKRGVVIGEDLTYNDGTSLVDVGAGGDPHVMELTLTTPRGGQYQTTLSDGTKVWLNAGSSLRYPLRFSGDNRTVALEGEAYFDVSHDARRPFIVAVNDTKIEVLGTQFNVNSYARITTTLVEGSVKVANATGEQLLAPGQEACVGNSITVHAADIDKATAWKNGYFHFKDDNMMEIMDQLARWYDVEVTYRGTVPVDKGYNGRIRREVNLSKVLEMLTYVSRARFEVKDRRVTVIIE